MNIVSNPTKNGITIIEEHWSTLPDHVRTTNHLDGIHINSAAVAIVGTAGELVQGRLNEEEDFLITNPINLMSRVGVIVHGGQAGVLVSPWNRTKAKRAVLATLKLFGRDDLFVHININSAIPTGKGMASSTADIVGAVEATALALGQTITPEQVSQIATAIEPSDGIMYRGVVAYNHRCGRLLEHFGAVPPMQQMIVDLGGCVDTIAFNRIPKNYSQQEMPLLAEAFALVREGVRTTSLAKIAQGATASALINQRLLPKPELEMILQIAQRAGAYGTACAHSGTILSLIFDPDDRLGPEKARKLFEGIDNRHFGLFLTRSAIAW